MEKKNSETKNLAAEETMAVSSTELTGSEPTIPREADATVSYQRFLRVPNPYTGKMDLK